MKIPYGYYLNDKNQVSIDPTKADAVIMIYDIKQRVLFQSREITVEHLPIER